MKNTQDNLNIFREKILYLLKNDKEEMAKKLMIQIAKDDFLDEKDFEWMYQFFSPIYDELFYDLMFENIHLKTKTKELLEELSLPFFQMEDSLKYSIIKHIK